ncbi:hypothetical protein RchiOBHm_Chr3g0472561 [Rosa chinensis]|uniref:Uncharacterized protein n=1 Tax=Rosa chinensis TaxID=74649 RepID=A0A2P6RBN9_ROSCH|nr:hypothetical protein RchiOBHm_Chr3g0472561 [Rosa chinensis]
MACTDGEITVVEPNGEEAVVIDIDPVAAMRRHLAVAENVVTTPSGGYPGSRGRVPQSLINISPTAIAPEMVSIGPFYHGKEILVDFEDSKLWFLNRLLSRTKRHGGPDRLKDLFEAVQKLENLAKGFYDEEVPMRSPEFIKMMVLDGCFIIELFRHLGRNEDVLGFNNPISAKPWLIPIITRDLLKLENQLPFFVLERLFRITAPAEDHGDPLALLALKFFNLSLPRLNDDVLKSLIRNPLLSREIDNHLLGLFHYSVCSTRSTNEKHQLSPFRLIPAPFLALPQLPPLLEQSEDHRVSPLRYWSVSIPIFCLRWSVSTIFYCLGWSIAILRLLYNVLFYCLRWSVSILTRFLSLTLSNSEEHRVLSIQSTTQLRPSGVKFKPHKADNFLEINFTNRVLQIPPITINDLTITVFINCLAYEHSHDRDLTDGSFTHYIAFLSCLINSPRDVAFLCAEGIIASYSHNDLYIAGLFNRLREKVYFHRNTCGYLDGEFRAVEAYYSSHWGTFMRTYFSTPWSFISVVSAIILLVLTGGQTVLAVLSYIDQRGKRL